uniref:Major facilitator superfamily (MFS) profile domain-containing protein n=1 Tax=Megaselia scalaris TaxID=36166 RepID=T1GM12_MEGSC
MPFATSKFNFQNKTFYLIGVMGTSLGRAVVAHSQSFELTVAAFAWIGMNKAFRIIFTQLIIPGYVPLNRLPAAAGLQLLITGIFTLGCGPIVGMIKDATNYTVTIHFLNGICFLAGAAWVIEDLFFKPKKQMDEK